MNCIQIQKVHAEITIEKRSTQTRKAKRKEKLKSRRKYRCVRTLILYTRPFCSRKLFISSPVPLSPTALPNTQRDRSSHRLSKNNKTLATLTFRKSRIYSTLFLKGPENERILKRWKVAFCNVPKAPWAIVGRRCRRMVQFKESGT